MKALVVDDEKLIVKGLKFSLEQEGYEVDCAYDGQEAVDKCKEKEYDIVLLDLMLPILSGYEVCQQVREFSDMPIIMLTAKGDDMDKILGLEYGADDYITKPFNILEVKARIKAIIRRNKKRSVSVPQEPKVIISGKMKLDIEAINVPRLLTNVSEQTWQGIPKGTKIGNLSLKTIRMSEVESYYLRYFGLELSAYLDQFSLYMSSNQYHHHLAVNQWLSSTKRVMNNVTYGLALIDYYYPETTHIDVKGPDGLHFRFNFIEVV